MTETKAAPAKRTAEDVEVIIRRASAGDWLFVQRKFDMTRAEIAEDVGMLSVVLAFLIGKQTGGITDLDQLLNMPGDELEAYLNLEEDSPKA